MERRNWVWRLLAPLLLCSAAASATPITFIHSGSRPGALAGSAFASTGFTITALADTDDKRSCGAHCYAIDHRSASITIDGLGTFDFLMATRTSFRDDIGYVGFGLIGSDLFNGRFNAALLDGWDMESSIGPITGFGTTLQWGSPFGVQTSGGLLGFNTGTTRVTFEAVAGTVNGVPEPGTTALVAAALVAFTSVERRTRHRKLVRQG